MNEVNLSLRAVAMVLVLMLLAFLVCVLVLDVMRKRSKQERREAARAPKRALEELKSSVSDVLLVDFDMIHEPGTQDEIVRVVNLRAHVASVMCVSQDRVARGLAPLTDQIESNTFLAYSGWDVEVSAARSDWSEARNIALEIAPELKDRMPHFSQFEPLKSYNEANLLRKRAGSQGEESK